MSYSRIYQSIYRDICPELSKEEACSVTQQLLEHYADLKPVDKLLNTPMELTAPQSSAIDSAVKRLKQHEPLQYVLEQVHFLGHLLRVTPDVLIPRPETEEMTKHILDHVQFCPGDRVLDICTGSGAIAIAIKKHFPETDVHAIDICPKALAVTKENAHKLGANICLSQVDILHVDTLEANWNLIVSNPPYICEKEREYMHKRVLEYEPHKALFVPDHDPLLFYKKISRLSFTSLRPRGKLYFEINEAMGKLVANLLIQEGFLESKCYKDLQGKDRWVVGN